VLGPVGLEGDLRNFTGSASFSVQVRIL
jgi:hypothetical protein